MGRFLEFEVVFNSFDLIGLKHCIITSKQNYSERIQEILIKLEKFNLSTIQLVLEFSSIYISDSFGEIVYNSKKISSVLLYNSPFEKNYGNCIYCYKEDLNRSFKRDRQLFRINFELFSESQYHHTYFNRKLYIGPNGEIKNAPECEETFGNIKDLNSVEDLKEIISTVAFQKYWFVHKDLCDVCKYCEFRHMCVDNRMPFERADNQWYHKIECNYNPFIAKWEGDPGYRTLSECGVISNENEFSIDHDRIAEINKEIWEEE